MFFTVDLKHPGADLAIEQIVVDLFELRRVLKVVFSYMKARRDHSAPELVVYCDEIVIALPCNLTFHTILTSLSSVADDVSPPQSASPPFVVLIVEESMFGLVSSIGTCW